MRNGKNRISLSLKFSLCEEIKYSSINKAIGAVLSKYSVRAYPRK